MTHNKSGTSLFGGVPIYARELEGGKMPLARLQLRLPRQDGKEE